MDDVVPVLVFDALDDAALQLGYDQLLLVKGDALQSLLDHPAPVHLKRQRLDFGAELKIGFMVDCNQK